jgi:hypothetical protein
MRYKRKLIALFFLFCMLSGLPAQETSSPTQKASLGTITGRVTNGTLEDQPVAQLEVTLVTISEDEAESFHKTVTDREGAFGFKELRVEPEISFAAVVDYRSVKYFSNRVQLDSESPIGELPIQVFEKSADASTLTVSSRHLIIKGFDGGLRVQEMIYLKNKASYTYVSEDSSALRFHLPAGASNLGTGSHLNKEDVSVDADSILISSPVRPDGQEITYRYDLAEKSRTHRLEYKVDYTTEQFDVFVSIPGANLNGENLERSEEITIEGFDFQRLSGQHLDAGTAVTLNIEMPVHTGGYSVQIWLIMGAFFMAAAALIFPFLRRPRETDIDPMEILVAEKERLIEEIAQLDYDFQQGNTEQAAYLTLREQKKHRALAFSRQLR